MTHRDVTYDSDAEYEYECLNCGTTVSAVNYPGGCPDCESAMRNRGMPCE
ncbi:MULTISPECIES: rubrerythrin-like domain-containing protein [Halorussus]|nr:rubrerythrin-like domain-containing protein [Halorussus vallis]USZ75807.1 rubrerythrin-like domain-containing protein [Halorussus vallis]